MAYRKISKGQDYMRKGDILEDNLDKISSRAGVLADKYYNDEMDIDEINDLLEKTKKICEMLEI